MKSKTLSTRWVKFLLKKQVGIIMVILFAFLLFFPIYTFFKIGAWEQGVYNHLEKSFSELFIELLSYQWQPYGEMFFAIISRFFVGGVFREYMHCMLTFAAAGGLAVSNFYYMHSKKQIDFYHGIPVKRKLLLNVNFGTAVLIYAGTYLCSLLVTLLLAGIKNILTIQAILVAARVYLLYILLFCLLYLIFTIAMLLTGRALTGITGGMILIGILPIGTRLVESVVKIYYGTYVTGGAGVEFLKNCSPMSVIIKLNREMHLKDSYQLLILLVVIGLLYLAAKMLYEKRKSEVAGKAMAFKSAEKIIKYILMFMGSIIVGVFMRGIAEQTKQSGNWMIASIIIAAFVIQIVLESIYHWDFGKCMKHMVDFVISAVVLLIVFAVLRFDVFGYESFVLEQEQIESVGIGITEFDAEYIYEYQSGDMYLFEEMELPVDSTIYTLLKEVRENHKKNETIQGDEKYWRTKVYVQYNMKNGTTKIRVYEVMLPEIKESVAKLYDYEQYKEVIYRNFNTEESMEFTIQNISIDEMEIYKEAEKRELFQTLKEEVMELNSGAVLENDAIMEIEYWRTKLLPDENMWSSSLQRQIIPVYEHFEKTRELLEKKKVETDLFESEIREAYVYGDANADYMAILLEENEIEELIPYLMVNIEANRWRNKQSTTSGYLIMEDGKFVEYLVKEEKEEWIKEVMRNKIEDWK